MILDHIRQTPYWRLLKLVEKLAFPVNLDFVLKARLDLILLKPKIIVLFQDFL